MSPGQTGHITGQMGRVPGTDGTHTRGCPAKILYVYCFFLSPVPWTPNRNEGTKTERWTPKTGTRAIPKTKTTSHSPKPPSYKTALLFPLDLMFTIRCLPFTASDSLIAPITFTYSLQSRESCSLSSGFDQVKQLGCRKWGCNKWGFKGCLATLPGNRPKSAFFALFLPFSPVSEGCEEHLENQENGGERPFSSDILRFA